ncbi:very short patch repair endonuclease [Streptomyces sp. NPDC094154]|uniref:very short patch repair endonuclease n=1 Tax=Streptomyces sp. NPDC094154 TaxID=3366059 RepID=UPI003818A74E
MTRSDRVREQDRAAGGASKRFVAVEDGNGVPATVVLTPVRRTGRIVARLQWTSAGRKQRLLLGEVNHPTRSANLRAAWRLAEETGLLVEEDVKGSWATSAGTRASMRSNRGRDTKPERRLRSALHKQGLRYRVSVRPVPTLRRTADLLFTRYKVAVFVDGCYWHGCPVHGSMPSSNRDFWVAKIEGNKRRDAETDRLLVEQGWFVVRAWEHTAIEDAVTLVRLALEESQSHLSPRAIREDVR